jgi:ankyrin repeat protein
MAPLYSDEEREEIRRYWRTPLHFEVFRNREDSVAQLLADGLDTNARGPGERIPLHYAVRNLKIVRMLIEHGSDVNALDDDRVSPLDCAAVDGTPEVGQALVDSGATSWNTALVASAANGNLPMIRWLLSLKVDVDSVVSGRTALFWAAYRSFTEVARALLERGASPNVSFNNRRLLAIAGAMEKSGDGSHYQRGRGRESDVARLLIEYGAEL